MVSNTGNSATQSTGIYTPVVDVWGEVKIKFTYKLDAALTNGARRWFKIWLTYSDLTPYGDPLDSVEITGTPGTVYTYERTFSYPQDQVGSGHYRVYVNYQGIGGSTRIGIDQFEISNNQVYTGGCNQAPVAVNDVIIGNNTHQAEGDVTPNDSDPDDEFFDATLITPSPHGTVVLNSDGTFTFTPNAGWVGSSTTFTYQLCDYGSPIMCSNIATVTLRFPTGGSLPVTLVDFKGLSKDNGEVELSWETTFEQNSNRFEVQRSFDGTTWETVGTLPAANNSSTRKTYSFVDKVGNALNRKDVYYQLRQVDNDTRAFMSKILIVRVYNTRALKMVSVTPNPVQNDINVSLQLNESSFVLMKVLNTSGAEMMRKSVKAGAGANTFVIDGTSKLRPGLYMLEVTINSKERMIVKLLKD